MIRRTHRFHGLGSLRPVYRTGRSLRSETMAIKFSLNERRRLYRLAVVVSKKVNKSAVVRNRIRRRIYEVVRGFEGSINQPYDIVVTVFDEKVAKMSADELSETINRLLKQGNMLSL